MITINRRVNEQIKGRERGEEKWMKLIHADNFLGKYGQGSSYQ